MDGGDWRDQLHPDSRQRIVNRITGILRRHLPFTGAEGLQESKKIALAIEEKIYTASTTTSQSDYLWKASLKMLALQPNPDLGLKSLFNDRTEYASLSNERDQMINVWQLDSPSQRRGMVPIHQTPSQILPKNIASSSSIDLSESNNFLELNIPTSSIVTAQQNMVQRNVSDTPRALQIELKGFEEENNVRDGSPPSEESEPLESLSLLQSTKVLDDKDKRIQAGSGQDNTKFCTSKQAATRKLDEEYGIDYNILRKYSDKKLQDVAYILGVSRSTLKRTCRKYNILRWPPCKQKKVKRTLPESKQAIEGNVEDGKMENESVSNLLCLKKDGSRIMVKVIFENDIIIKFELSVSSTKLDLEEKVATRLNLSIGSFLVKYLDEENEWILVACDEDLTTCISTSRSLGSAIIRMMVSYN